MGRTKETPRYNIISMRVSDGELKTLKEIMGKTQKSVSDLMRDAIKLLLSASS